MPKLKIPELEGQKKSNVQQSLTNTASGYAALYNNTTGLNNTASGYAALYYNTTGSANTAYGYAALYYNNGSYNTASGSHALYNNTTGIQNSASGRAALSHNTTGSHNTASGVYALYYNNGSNNTASGVYALYKNKSGEKNTAIGNVALMNNTTGRKNTAVGIYSGGKNTTGNSNVFIGFRAGDNSDYQTKSNKLVIANGSQSTNELITGDFAAHEVNINGDLHATGNLTQNSDGRLKKDIKPLTHALDSILQLQAKTYRWKEDTTFANKADIGLVAQDVEKVFPELVAEDGQGYKAIAYSKLTAVLIEAMKEQQGQMTAQQDQIAVLEKENAQFTDQIASLEKENTQLKALVEGQMKALLARVAMLEGESLAAN
jgi:hypothetical protein